MGDGAPAARRARAWCVYFVRCRDGSLYCGVSNDVARRVRAHNVGRGARYTRARRPVELVFRRRCASRADALRIEAALKRIPRARKLQLVLREGRSRGFRALLRRGVRKNG